VAVISLALVLTLVAVAASSLRPSDDAIVVGNHYGIGYPLHGGLAGPSRVSSGIQTVQGSRYGAGYPLHGGLAGPSGIIQTVEGNVYGAGYPLHGGLAGPGRTSTIVSTPEGNVFAWPSQIGDGR